MWEKKNMYKQPIKLIVLLGYGIKMEKYWSICKIECILIVDGTLAVNILHQIAFYWKRICIGFLFLDLLFFLFHFTLLLKHFDFVFYRSKWDKHVFQICCYDFVSEYIKTILYILSCRHIGRYTTYIFVNTFR